MPPKKPLAIVLLGPTASGKTDLALQLAELLDLSIHNVDSRQLYIGMDIGTAKPTREQQQRIEHFLLDLRYPNEPLTLKEFQMEANISLEKIFDSGKTAFLVGGSGLYLKAITGGLIPPAVSPQKKLREQLNALGQPVCYQLLMASDPHAAQRIAEADGVRTQRALEVLYATGKPISLQQKAKPPSWQIIELGLDPKNLRERIAKRTKKLYQNGLLDETKQLAENFGQDLPMLQTIGYREAVDVLKGRLSLDEATAITIRRTQQFAKRQRTWFRRKHSPHWLNDEEPLREALSLIKTGLG